MDADSLTRFVATYQSVTPLKLGELWAIPIMLRLTLIENLRRVGLRVTAGVDERDLANTWADRMIEVADQDPKSLNLVIADIARSKPPMESAFVAELARRLLGQSAALALPLTWIEQWLAESHLTIEQLVQLENQRQASDQVSISSLRNLNAIDWRNFVESLSVVDKVLHQDPHGSRIGRIKAVSGREESIEGAWISSEMMRFGSWGSRRTRRLVICRVWAVRLSPIQEVEDE